MRHVPSHVGDEMTRGGGSNTDRASSAGGRGNDLTLTAPEDDQTGHKHLLLYSLGKAVFARNASAAHEPGAAGKFRPAPAPAATPENANRGEEGSPPRPVSSKFLGRNFYVSSIP